MIAKFHSAPDRSMETTLTISLPPVQSIRSSRAEREKEKEREREWEKETKETKEREKREKKERKKEEQMEREREREKELEREADPEKEGEVLVREPERVKTQSEKNVSYKDKFQKMREKYDKATAAHETHERDLEILNAKMKKLQAENDLLLDATLLADSGLYDKYFPTRSGSTSPTLGPASSSALGLPIPAPLASSRSHSHSHAATPHLAHIGGGDHFGPPQPPQASSMAPPPPVSATASTTSTTTGGPPRSMLPPPSSAGSINGTGTMPPPTSGTSSNGTAMAASASSATVLLPSSAASSNGTFVDVSDSTGRPTRRTSMSSRSRRRSDVAGVPLAPEDLDSENAAAAAPNGIEIAEGSTPTYVASALPEDEPFQSPRANGSGSAARSSTGTPNGINLDARRGPESSREATPVDGDGDDAIPHSDPGDDDDQDHDQDMEGPVVPEPHPGDGGGVVHSPTDGEDDEDDDGGEEEEEEEVDVDVDVDVEKMDVDEDDNPSSVPQAGTSTTRRGLGSLRRGGRG